MKKINNNEDLLNGQTIEDLESWFLKVDNLRRSIVKVSSMFERLNESPNPFYGVIPFTGSLLLNESYDSPSEFFTPLGKWKILGGGFSDGKTAESILDELGIKWTRLEKPEVTKMGVFGGVIQIDEDQFGNKYPPLDSGVETLNDIFSIIKENIIRLDYDFAENLFKEINKTDLLRHENKENNG